MPSGQIRTALNSIHNQGKDPMDATMSQLAKLANVKYEDIVHQIGDIGVYCKQLN